MAASRSQASSRGSSGALTKTIYVRVTDSEHAAFTSAAEDGKLSTAEWARRVLRSTCPPMTLTLPVITGRVPLVAEVPEGTYTPGESFPIEIRRLAVDDDPDLKF